MKRLLLAVTVLLGPAVGLVSAEYLMIKIDLNKLQAPPPPPGTSPTPAPPPPRPPATRPPKNRPPGFPRGPRVTPPTGTQPPSDQEDEPLWATAYLELKRRPETAVAVPNSALGLIPIEHPWGKALIPQPSPRDGSLGNLGFIRFYSNPSVARRFEEDRKATAKEGKTPDKLLHLAERALEHGLTRSFLETMDELAKEDPNHPAVKAVNKVRAEMKRPVSADDPAAAALIEELKGANYRTVPSDEGHYLLFTDLRRGTQNEVDVKKWLDRLEATYHNFFYWFAVRGRALPVPAHRLVAVVISSHKDFDDKHESVSPGPMVADGFLARRDNVVVFSAERRDEAYETLEKINRSEWQKYKVGRDDLLGEGMVKRLGKSMLVAKLQTLAILQKAMEEEAERASVTHHGTRQLLAATGLLPRSVVAAEWIHFGMASFFETPFKAYYPGVGLPSWLYLVEFKHLKKTGELGESQDVLLSTITDQFFIEARTRQRQIEASSETREEQEPLLHEDLKTARTTAWALTFYLARHRLDGLQRYFQELGSLPGELEFDEGVLQGCFARAFGLVDPTDPYKLDMGKVKQLADLWYKDLDGVSLDILDVQTEELKERSKQAHGPVHHRVHRPPPPAIRPNLRPMNPPPPPAVRPKKGG